MKKIVHLFLFLYISIGCKSIITSQYKFNRTFSFITKAEYLHYMDEKYSLNPDQILYIDSTSMLAFFSDISSHKIAQYYGSFLNDSTEIVKSEYLLKNLSCIGRVLEEMQKNTKDINDSLLRINRQFRNYVFRSAKNDTIVAFNMSRRVKIFLIHGYSMGTYFDRFFNDVSEWVKRHDNISVYVISVDPIQTLK